MTNSVICNGVVKKMQSTKIQNIVEYRFDIGSNLIDLNNFIGHSISIKFLDKIFCQYCKKEIKKAYFQGYCYPCMISAPQASECILRPELCRAHEGNARDMNWANDHCLKDHVVYLAITSGLKVGVTRSSQIPTRWIDQGAIEAVELAVTPNRFLAGTMEVFLKKHLSDKTHWQKMLKNDYDRSINLLEEKEKIIKLLDRSYKDYIVYDNEPIINDFPVIKNPEKIKSINFDKQDIVNGELTGIKGQYLIFDFETVFNVRRHTGYMINIEIKR